MSGVFVGGLRPGIAVAQKTCDGASDIAGTLGTSVPVHRTYRTYSLPRAKVCLRLYACVVCCMPVPSHCEFSKKYWPFLFSKKTKKGERKPSTVLATVQQARCEVFVWPTGLNYCIAPFL